MELLEIKPHIWRRLLVPVDIKLPKLNQCLQLTMAWTDLHLHQFKVGALSSARARQRNIGQNHRPGL